MSEPDAEHPAGPVTPQPPLISNYGLVLTVYILYLVGFLTGITVLIGVIIAYLQRGETNMQVSFPVSDHNILDWLGVFFCRSSNDPLRRWWLHLDMVGHLDSDSMRKWTPHLEQGQRDT